MNFNRRLVVYSCLILALSSGYIIGQDRLVLYVSTDGKDSNPGTIERPLQTVQHAADIAKPGTTVNIRGGVYCQQLVVKVSGNAQEGFITFRSEPGERAVLDGACLKPPEDDTAMVELDSVSFVRVQGLELRNYRTSDPRSVPWGIRVHGSGSHIEILHNNVHHIEQNFKRQRGLHPGANGVGIGVYGTDARTPITDLVIDGNEVHHLKTGASESLVVNGNVSAFRITKNVVHDNSNIGIDVIGFEKKASDPAVDRARDGVVSENTVYDIPSKENLAGHQPSSDGIYVDGGTRILIERNIVHDVDYGIELASEHREGNTSHILARNNLVYFCHAAGISIGGYDAKRGTTEDAVIVNNTLYGNDTFKTGTGEFLMQFYMRNNVFKNNIVYVGEHGRVMSSRSGRLDGVPTVIMDHNLYYFAAGPKAAKWNYDQKDYASFEEYVRGTGNDQHSLFADPLFVQPKSLNFHLRPDSPARGHGENLQTVLGDQDLDGHPRAKGETVDVGCYQSPI